MSSAKSSINPLDIKYACELYKSQYPTSLMVLIGIKGDSASFLNRQLLLYAAKNTPCLVIDCANVANPHSLFPEVDLPVLEKIYVIELELLYKFRDTLLRVPSIMRNIGAKHIVVTTINHLFHYQDELENKNIMDHAWRLLKILSKRYTIVAGIKKENPYLDEIKVIKNGSYRIKPTYNGRYYTR